MATTSRRRILQLAPSAAIAGAGISLVGVGLSGPAAADEAKAGDEADRALIRETLGHYFRGHATGDGAHIRKAFLPTAHIEGVRDGKFASWTLEEYASRFKGVPPADEATRTRTVDAIDVTGSAAVAKAILTAAGAVTTDYFVLLKLGAEWKIANKVWSLRRP